LNVAVDTNVLAYAEGLNGPEKQGAAADLLDRLDRTSRRLPVNVLGELFNVLVRKAKTSPEEARRRVLIWARWGRLLPTNSTSMVKAVELAAEHRLAIWDALILAAAAEAGCRLLLSEDMQDGFAWGGVTVVDPFRAPPSPLLEGAVRS